jgi:YVTN family beta-propeller protein
VHVSRLRRALGDGTLETHGRGYRLAVAHEQVDADRFAALASDGRALLDRGDAAAAVDRLGAALDLWRGPALDNFSYESFARTVIAQLEDARLAALEDRTEGQLQMGRGSELVPELEGLVAEHPLRERLIAGLMLALYRSGRHADALTAYRGFRDRLADDLGLDPGPELRELERRILQHDATLGVRQNGMPLRPRGHRTLLAAVALGLLALALATFQLTFDAARARLPRLAGRSGVVAIGTSPARLVSATSLAGAPTSLVAGSGSIWATEPGADAVLRIDPNSGEVIDRILVGDEPGSIVRGGGAIWAASSVGATLTRIDPAAEAVTQKVTLPGSNAAALAFGDGRVWVADSVTRRLFEIDPATGSLRRTLTLDVQPSAIVPAARAVWVASYGGAAVEELDPISGRRLARLHVGDGPTALALAASSLWVANSLDATVSRIDLATRAVDAPIPVGSGPTALAAVGGAVWVANQYSGTISRIDPRTDRAAATVAVGGAPTSLAVSGGRVWAGVAAGSGTHRGGTLVIDDLASTGSSTGVSIDPAFYSYANNPQFTGLAYDSLVTFQQSPGANGLQIVPDLALSIPMPHRGGLTYTFHLRSGIRYSDGQTLQASDLRRAIERLFRVGSIGSSFFNGVVGATACIRPPRVCDLSRGIVTDERAGTVTFQLTAPDPDFLFKLTVEAYAAPIPPGTPDHEPGSRTVPGTGPYEITTVNRSEIRFVRNPFFREWSHAAQPAGDPDSIEWHTVRSPQAALTAIAHGRADWWFGQLPASQYHRLELEDPGQLHSNPLFGVEFFPLNTTLAPFNSLKVRQALNYAINRLKIASLYGGSSFVTPTCQPIAPGLPGYHRFCPYTLHPGRAGTWRAPNLARAQRLVRQSGTRGDRILLWGEPDEGYVPPSITSYVAGVLRTLGYRVRQRLVPFASVTQAMRTHFQMSTDGDWAAAYPDPSSYIPQFFSCGGGNSNGFYCNPQLDREMRRATQLELTDPPRANSLWDSVDRQLTDDAVWVPTVTPREVEFTSSRLHNYEYNPVWGFLADQAWLQ